MNDGRNTTPSTTFGNRSSFVHPDNRGDWSVVFPSRTPSLEAVKSLNLYDIKSYVCTYYHHYNRANFNMLRVTKFLTQLYRKYGLVTPKQLVSAYEINKYNRALISYYLCNVMDLLKPMIYTMRELPKLEHVMDLDITPFWTKRLTEVNQKRLRACYASLFFVTPVQIKLNLDRYNRTRVFWVSWIIAPALIALFRKLDRRPFHSVLDRLECLIFDDYKPRTTLHFIWSPSVKRKLSLRICYGTRPCLDYIKPSDGDTLYASRFKRLFLEQLNETKYAIINGGWEFNGFENSEG